MIYPIATRKVTAFSFAMAWLAFVGQDPGYGQPPTTEGKMYWANLERGIYRSSLDGTNIEQLVKPELRYPSAIALDVLRGKIYWANKGRGGGIYRSDLDGSNLKPLMDDNYIVGGGATNIALDVLEGKIYWTSSFFAGDHPDGYMAWANLDGSNSEILFDQQPFLGDIALDLVGGKVYWTEQYYGYDSISRADLNGQNIEYNFIRPDSGFLGSIALDGDGGKIYWTNAATIQRADLNGQNIEEVLTISDGFPEEITLDLDRGKIYWTNPGTRTVQRAELLGIDLDLDRSDDNPGTRTIQRADLNGQNIEYLFDLEDDVTRGDWIPRTGIALNLDQGKIYWTDSGPGTIQRADLNGQNREVLFEPIVRKPYGLALYLDKMYWSDVVKGTIQRADLNGQNREVLVTGLNRPKGIALLDGDKIYWADAGLEEYWGYSETGEWGWVAPEKGKIQAANWDGSNVKDVLTGLSYLEDIALDATRSKLYWTDNDTALVEGIIHRADLDGANVEDIITGIAPFSFVKIALDLDADKLYWTNQGTGTIQRADLGGTNVEGIFSLPDGTWSSLGALALDLVGNKIYWGVWGAAPSIDPIHMPTPRWLEFFRSNLDGSQVKKIYEGVRVDGYSAYLPPPTSIALYISHPTSVSTPSTTPAIPVVSGLSPNFPNPFNASTQITYDIATPGPVRLTIYNTLGQPVRTLVDQFQAAGSYQVRWDARDQQGAALAAGVYLVRLRYPGGEQTRRLLLLK